MDTNLFFSSMMSMSIRRFLSVLLYLITLHSFMVGVILVFIPFRTLTHFGYQDYHGAFFKVQGGVFHIVMSIIYFMAARDPINNRILVFLIILIKFAATLFLFSYYLFADRIWMVAASGAGDLIMGVLVLLLFLRLPKPTG